MQNHQRAMVVCVCLCAVFGMFVMLRKRTVLEDKLSDLQSIINKLVWYLKERESDTNIFHLWSTVHFYHHIPFYPLSQLSTKDNSSIDVLFLLHEHSLSREILL